MVRLLCMRPLLQTPNATHQCHVQAKRSHNAMRQHCDYCLTGHAEGNRMLRCMAHGCNIYIHGRLLWHTVPSQHPGSRGMPRAHTCAQLNDADDVAPQRSLLQRIKSCYMAGQQSRKAHAQNVFGSCFQRAAKRRHLHMPASFGFGTPAATCQQHSAGCTWPVAAPTSHGDRGDARV